jgi:hypothetical protein
MSDMVAIDISGSSIASGGSFFRLRHGWFTAISQIGNRHRLLQWGCQVTFRFLSGQVMRKITVRKSLTTMGLRDE